MSILIKNMEMPAGCGRCSFSNGETGFCCAANEYIPMVNKPEFCPLIEIPPHGRLIDADKAVVIIERLRDRCCGIEDMAFALKWAAEIVGRMPTIIPAEGDG